MESREGKAERVYFKLKERQTMHVASDKEIMEDMLKHNPKRWLEVESKRLEGLIVDYNNVAFEQGEDVIMCFKMTPDEYAEATKEALDGLVGDPDIQTTEDQE